MKYTGKAWKHHISEHFSGTDSDGNGARAGGAIFLDYEKMLEYLKRDGRQWHICELNLQECPILFDFENDYVATILIDWVSESGFYPICL